MDKAIEALKLFNLKGAITSIAPLGFGHINDSYAVHLGGRGYLLQRLNTNVFLKPNIVENNLFNLLSYHAGLFPEHLKGNDGNYHQYDGKNWWRLQEFVHDSYSPVALLPNELNEIAKGFGQFTAQFAGEKLDAYQESIPQFHNLQFRLNQLEEAIRNDHVGRVEPSIQVIEEIKSFAWIAIKFGELVEEGLPHRVCHNDAKAGNCLLSKTSGHFLKIVDLDTVGPGYVLFDLGDMLRSMLFNIPENQSDLDHLKFDQIRFNIILDSYLGECGHLLDPIEIDSLSFGGLYMTYIMAVRFLTDYLNGDIYYKISHAEENLIRTNNQLRILNLMNQALK